MNETAFALRLLWKELRTQTSFFVSVVISSLFFQIVFWLLSRRTETSDWAMMCVAIAMPCLYALGAAGTAFAGEREEGTDTFLRLRGVPHLPVWTSKFVFLVGSMTLMSGLLWIIAGVLGTNAVAESFYQYLPQGLCLSLQLLAWGILASMLTSTALTAVVLGVSAFLLTWAIVTMASPEFFSPVHYFITISLIAIDIAMTDYWLRTESGRIAGWWQGLQALRTEVEPRRKRRWHAHEAATPARRIWQRLCWHERRQSWFLYVVIGIQCMLAIVALMSERGLFNLCCVVMVSLLFYTPFHCGLKVFRAEQQHSRFRFFNDRGIAPSWIWFSKQAVWMTSAFLTTAVLFGAVWIVMESDRQTEGYPRFLIDGKYFPGGIIVWMLVAYGIGQLCSLFFKRGVIAWFMGLMFAGTAAVWWQEIAFLHGSMAFVIAIWLWTLLISYVRTGDWLTERTGRWPRIRLASVIIIPFGLLTATWAVLRVVTVPATAAPGLEQAWFPNQAPLTGPIDTALRSARDQLLQHENRLEFQKIGSRDGAPPIWSDLSLEQQSFVIDNEDVVQELMAVADRNRSSKFRENGFDAGILSNHNLDSIQNLLCCDARRLEADRALNDALERYLTVLRIARHRVQGGAWWEWRAGNQWQTHLWRWLPGWVMADGQSSTNVRNGLARLTEEWHQFPTASRALNNTLFLDWHILQEWTSLQNWPVTEVPPRYRQADFLGDVRGQVYLLMPFEKVRAERILLRRYASLFQQLRQKANWNAYGTKPTNRLFMLNYGGTTSAAVEDATMQEWLASSPLADAFGVPDLEDTVSRVTNREMAYRMAVLAIWLTDTARETGQYPRTLAAIASKLPNNFTPADPWHRDDFLYFPDGIQKGSLMRNNRLWDGVSDPPLIASREFSPVSQNSSTSRDSNMDSHSDPSKEDVVEVLEPLWPSGSPTFIVLPPVQEMARN